jgi:hypothetical protein
MRSRNDRHLAQACADSSWEQPGRVIPTTFAMARTTPCGCADSSWEKSRRASPGPFAVPRRTPRGCAGSSRATAPTTFAEPRRNSRDCADSSWEKPSQLPSLRPALPRRTPRGCADSSWERFSQLPLIRPAVLRSIAQIQVGKGMPIPRLPNLIFFNDINALTARSSCGGETHPLRGWGRTAPSGFSHSHPQGVGARAAGLVPGARAPPRTRPRSTERTTTASSAKNTAVAALTTTTPIKDAIMAPTFLNPIAADAKVAR